MKRIKLENQDPRKNVDLSKCVNRKDGNASKLIPTGTLQVNLASVSVCVTRVTYT